MGLTGAKPVYWYALHIRSNAEKKAQELLQQRHIPEYLPLYTEKRRWTDRTKTIERPVFPGYLFARFDPEMQKRDILAVPGVLRILGAPDPIAVKDDEIENIRRLVEAGPVLPCGPVVGETVVVRKGPLAGVIGTVQKIKGAFRVVVNVHLLNRAVAAEVDADSIAKA